MRSILLSLTVFVGTLALSEALQAQRNNAEIGLGIGGSFYTSKEVTNAGQKVDAGFKSGVSGAFWVGHNNFSRFGGEIRYTYTRNSAQLSGLSLNPTFSADAHAIGYDLLYYANDRRHKIRPFVFGGVGAKVFRGTGTERSRQELNQFAFLTKTNQTKVFVDFGVGVKWQISERFGVRAEVRDVVSPFPAEIIAPAFGSSLSGGWTHNIVPLVGFTYLF